MKNKFIALLLVCSLTPALYAGVDTTLTYTSDYMWRGVTQSMGQGAWQGRVHVDKGGVYGGVWASEVDYNDEATYEMDLYLGYKVDLSSMWSVDVGVVQYNFDKVYDDKEEVFVKTSFGLVSVGYFVNMANSDDDFMKFNVGIPFVKWADVSLEYGMWDRDTDYAGLKVSKDWDNWTLGLMVMEEARQGQFMDMSSLTLSRHF